MSSPIPVTRHETFRMRSRILTTDSSRPSSKKWHSIQRPTFSTGYDYWNAKSPPSQHCSRQASTVSCCSNSSTKKNTNEARAITKLRNSTHDTQDQFEQQMQTIVQTISTDATCLNTTLCTKCCVVQRTFSCFRHSTPCGRPQACVLFLWQRPRVSAAWSAPVPSP